MAEPVPIVLASASRARARVLEKAGVTYVADPASVDEGAVKRAMRTNGATAAETAEALAALKARQVARKHSGALVVGADQLLVCEERWFDKPSDLTAAREQLIALRGRTHELITAAVVVRQDEIIWHYVDLAQLTMRPFSDAFLDFYLAYAGEEICRSVGGYAVEEIGVQLFSRISGSHFSILGLPLLPLLDFMRAHGVVAE